MNNDRYHRQMLLPGLGEAGQERLRRSHALLVGCGALGTVLADTLARAGVGTLTIVDRDLVEITNLQRQVLYDEDDVDAARPKAVAAAAKLGRINRDVVINAFVEDFNHTNAEHLAGAADLILDGLDNFETRYLLNDLSVALGRPYIYGGAVGTVGMACTFLPHPGSRRGGVQPSTVVWTDEQATPCLRCVFPDAPPPGSSPTCDTAGVLASVAGMVAHHQATAAIKLLTDNIEAIDRSLISFDLWRNEFNRMDVSHARRPGCLCCGRGEFEYLDGRRHTAAATLCGRGAVQINPRIDSGGDPKATGAGQGRGGRVDLAALSRRLAAHGEFRVNEHLIRGTLTGVQGEGGRPVELTVFHDGRAIVAGIDRTDLARSIYDRYVGG